jgi:hypothetical protein
MLSIRFEALPAIVTKDFDAFYRLSRLMARIASLNKLCLLFPCALQSTIISSNRLFIQELHLRGNVFTLPLLSA